ncbi:MAG: hypothetical protein WA996_22810 [Candidatus Promineifilaceae bacterium]
MVIDRTEDRQAKRDNFRESFRPHFDKMICDPISKMVTTRDALWSFILMALVIDYLAGFWWGESTKGRTKQVYTGFVENYFPKGRYNSDSIYAYLRNGLVHSFTIKNSAFMLTHNHPELHLNKHESGRLILNAGDFRDDLFSAKNKYFDEVEACSPAAGWFDVLDKFWMRLERDGFLVTGQFDGLAN